MEAGEFNGYSEIDISYCDVLNGPATGDCILF